MVRCRKPQLGDISKVLHGRQWEQHLKQTSNISISGLRDSWHGWRNQLWNGAMRCHALLRCQNSKSRRHPRTFVVGRAIYSHPGGSSISLPVIVPLIPPFCRGFSIAVWLPEGTRSSECYCDIIAIDKSIRLEEVFRFTMTLKYGMVEFKTKRIPEVQYRSAPTEVNTQDWRVEN